MRCGPCGPTETAGTSPKASAARRWASRPAAPIETGRADPLIRDEFAHLLVSAAGPAWARMADGHLDWQHDDDVSRREFESAVDYQAVRTHFFDQLLRGVGAGGHRAGGDPGGRSGLPRATGCTGRQTPSIFEIDQPKVLQLQGADPAGSRCRATGRLPSGRRRPARRLGRRAHRRRLRSRTAPPPGWPRGCCRTCPSDAQDRLVRHRHRPQRAGQPDRRRGVRADDGSLTEERRSARRERQARVRDRMGTGSTDVEALLYNEADRAEADGR